MRRDRIFGLYASKMTRLWCLIIVEPNSGGVSPIQMSRPVKESDVSVDAAVLAEALQLSAAEVLRRIRARQITAVHEHGIAEDLGRERLIFYDRNRRVQLLIDEAGNILECKVAKVHRRGIARLQAVGPTHGPTRAAAGAASGSDVIDNKQR